VENLKSAYCDYDYIVGQLHKRSLEDFPLAGTLVCPTRTNNDTTLVLVNHSLGREAWVGTDYQARCCKPGDIELPIIELGIGCARSNIAFSIRPQAFLVILLSIESTKQCYHQSSLVFPGERGTYFWSLVSLETFQTVAGERPS
jgi:hypothetical protein